VGAAKACFGKLQHVHLAYGLRPLDFDGPVETT